MEIRMRRNLPLSLTTYQGNVLINSLGTCCSLNEAICCDGSDLRLVLGNFCGGSTYKYFHHLKDGFAVDRDGWRMGVTCEKNLFYGYMPEDPIGINLRIPRFVPNSADDFIEILKEKGLGSTLILSAPGNGKTTLLRALAISLASGKLGSPLRVAVIDEKEELFPKAESEKSLVDLILGYDKKAGIEMAVRLFSPQIILCDEIGNEKEVSALLSSCTGGCTVFASCHAEGLKEAKRIRFLAPLLESGLFSGCITIFRKNAIDYQRELFWEKIS